MPVADARSTRLVAPFIVAVVALLAFTSTLAAIGNPSPAPPRPAGTIDLSTVPLSFEPNYGQADPAIWFLARGAGASFALRATDLVMTLAGQQPAADAAAVAADRLAMHLVGANPTPAATGQDRLTGVVHYLIGADPTRWQTDVPTFARVHYQSVYPGVDVVYYGSQRQLEYDFVIAPGADPGQIQLRFTGASALRLSDDGDLLLATAAGEVRHRHPASYQDMDGERRPVASRYVLLAPDTVGFAIGAYDPGRPLVIDPLVVAATLIGSGGADNGLDIAVGAGGQIYITGVTSGAADDTNAFVAKLDPTGKTVLYTTYLGDQCNDSGRGIAVDAAGNAYITGQRGLLDQWDLCNIHNIFVAKLNPAGNALLYDLLVGGGDKEDTGSDIVVDAVGAAYVVGHASYNFPTTAGAFQTEGGFPGDAFVMKVSTTGQVVYATYLGGGGIDFGDGIAIDAAGNAYVTGTAASADFPTTTTAVQPTNPAFYNACFVSKLNAGGTDLLYSTYLGGDRSTTCSNIAVNASGDAYVVGSTTSADFPTTAGAADRTCGSDGECNPTYVCNPTIPPTCHFEYVTDAVVARLAPGKSGAASLVYATFLGGENRDDGYGIAVNGAGQAHVVGDTASLVAFPIVNPLQPHLAGERDGFVATLSAAGALLTSTYYGGSGQDSALAVALTNGRAFVTGWTRSTTLPGAGASTNAGSSDAFVAQFDLGGAAPPPATATPTATPTTKPPTGGPPTATPTRTPTVTPPAGGPGPAPGTTWYFAEGWTGTGFDEYLTILNAQPTAAEVRLTFYRKGQAPVVRTRSVAANSRETVTVHDETQGVGRNNGQGWAVSTLVQSTNGVGIVVERPMYFAYRGGVQANEGHIVIGATTPQPRWYFAEGYTGPGFDEYLTIMNPNPAPVGVKLTFFRKGASPLIRSLTVGANTRETVAVHDDGAGVGRNGGRGWEVSALVESVTGGHIVVERPMYFQYSAGIAGGHNAMGATAPQPRWYFAEGYTGAGFDEYLTIMNPNPTPVTVRLTYFRMGAGPVVRTRTVGASTRETVAVHDETQGVGRNGGRGWAVSTLIESVGGGAIVVERPMYFTYQSGFRAPGGHTVLGAAAPREHWSFAEGWTGPGFDTYLTIMNPNPTPVEARFTFYRNGASPVIKTRLIDANSRETVAVHDEVDGVGRNGGRGWAVSAQVDSLSGGPIVVERPSYFHYQAGFSAPGGDVVMGYTP
ncbi:MAG: SBBP repeat-containing protein [Chloroflexi bacterium]|nr:SBBP repeat-containing protein [Chloroflexota bacterium]